MVLNWNTFFSLVLSAYILISKCAQVHGGVSSCASFTCLSSWFPVTFEATFCSNYIWNFWSDMKNIIEILAKKIKVEFIGLYCYQLLWKKEYILEAKKILNEFYLHHQLLISALIVGQFLSNPIDETKWEDPDSSAIFLRNSNVTWMVISFKLQNSSCE